MKPFFAVLAAALLTSAAPNPAYDLVIRGGIIYDGSGAAPYVGDVAVKGDRIIAALGAGRWAGGADRAAEEPGDPRASSVPQPGR
jgi:N-acyl-D-amino-acid deacylase